MLVDAFEGPKLEYLFRDPARSDLTPPAGWKAIGERDTRSLPGAERIEREVRDKGFWRGPFVTPLRAIKEP